LSTIFFKVADTTTISERTLLQLEELNTLETFPRITVTVQLNTPPVINTSPKQ